MSENIIIITAGAGYTRRLCNVCGSVSDDGMASNIVGATDGEIDFASGACGICRTCLDAGKEGAVARSKAYAERVREHLNWLESELPLLIDSVSDWKDGSEYDSISDEWENAVRKDYEEGRM